MWAKITFGVTVLLATLVVILLSVLSSKPTSRSNGQKQPWLDLSLYIQQQQPPPPAGPRLAPMVPLPDAAGALIFRRTLTEGPENTSRVVGRAQGFIIPAERFARSGFNIVYLSFDTPEYSGSLGVQAKRISRGGSEELTVVGGTGAFAFARGIAVFAAAPDGGRSPAPDVDSTYHVKLQLTFPNDQSRTIPG